MLSLEDWLRKVGFQAGNPFARKQADEEGDALQIYFVEHPAYNVLRDLERPRSVILHAPRGAGKSTARRMFEEYCAINAAWLRPLVVPLMNWTWTLETGRPINQISLREYLEELFRQIVVAVTHNLDQININKIHNQEMAGYWNWLCCTYGQYLRPSEQKRLVEAGLINSVDCAELAPYNLLRFPLDRRLLTLSHMIQALGFGTCYILIDRVDEFIATVANWQLGADLLTPFVANLPMVETPGLVLRCFVPSEVIDILQDRRLLRTDRIQCVPVTWSGPDGQKRLLEMLQRRLQAFSNDNIKSLSSLAPDLRALDKQLVEAAQESPRQLLNLGDLLLNICAQHADDDNLLIRSEYLEIALATIKSQHSHNELNVTCDAQPSPTGLKNTVPLLLLNPDGSIYRGTEPIEGWEHLPARQRRLLEYLYEQRGSLCRKDQIIAAVWTGDDIGDEDTLRKLAERLQKFIERDPKNPIYLKKVRGGNYLLNNTA